MTHGRSPEEWHELARMAEAAEDNAWRREQKRKSDCHFFEATKDFHSSLSDEEKARTLKYVNHYKEAIGKTTLTQWKNEKEDAWIFDISREWLGERLNNLRRLAKDGDTPSIVRQYHKDKDKLPER